MKCPVITIDNSPAGELELDDAVFGLPVRKDILSRMVQWQLAKRRAGTHKTKGISDIQGTTKRTVPVVYTGTVPDPFKEGREVIVTVERQGGRYVGQRDSLITKCPSKYTVAPSKNKTY